MIIYCNESSKADFDEDEESIEHFYQSVLSLFPKDLSHILI